MKDLLLALLGLVFAGCLTYGGYWVAKNVSYAVFYEGMVIETINETVKDSCLIK